MAPLVRSPRPLPRLRSMLRGSMRPRRMLILRPLLKVVQSCSHCPPRSPPSILRSPPLPRARRRRPRRGMRAACFSSH